MGKAWKVAKTFSKGYSKQFKDYNDIVVQMLFNRGIRGQKEADDFFNPKYEKLFDPDLLEDMGKAVKRIIKALDRGENIVVFGDYDVDSLTATTIVYQILERLGAKVSFYIPHRMKEGYGLNKGAVDFLADKKIDLIITVDNGVSNKEEVAYAKKKGIDVVITDHHEAPKILPKAVAIVNPKKNGSKYPFKELAGVGVAFKLVLSLVAEINKRGKKEIIPAEQLKWYLDLAALGTISDIVPLVSENRIIAHYGLVVLSKTRNLGLRTIEKVAGIDLKKSNPYMVGFQIGPRLNAAGRLSHASVALELLLSGDENEAGVLALKLERLNRERQDIILKNMELLRAEYEGREMERILLLKKEGWTAGIIGLIAGRMSEEFSRPVFCMAEEEGMVKGSVRSSINFNVVENLRFFEKTFINYGGHSGAGGFSLRAEDYEVFCEGVIQHAREKVKEEDLVSNLKIEKEIEFENININLCNQIKRFEPFGHGNEEPLFLTCDVKIKDSKIVGKDGNHTKLKLTKNGKELDAILFNHGGLKDKLYYGKDIDIVYKIELNEWEGSRKIELKIIEIKT